jgi:hypothetical protein
VGKSSNNVRLPAPLQSRHSSSHSPDAATVRSQRDSLRRLVRALSSLVTLCRILVDNIAEKKDPESVKHLSAVIFEEENDCNVCSDNDTDFEDVEDPYGQAVV